MKQRAAFPLNREIAHLSHVVLDRKHQFSDPEGGQCWTGWTQLYSSHKPQEP